MKIQTAALPLPSTWHKSNRRNWISTRNQVPRVKGSPMLSSVPQVPLYLSSLSQVTPNARNTIPFPAISFTLTLDLIHQPPPYHLLIHSLSSPQAQPPPAALLHTPHLSQPTSFFPLKSNKTKARSSSTTPYHLFHTRTTTPHGKDSCNPSEHQPQESQDPNCMQPAGD